MYFCFLQNNKYNDKDLYDAEGSSDGEQQRHSPPPKNSENAKKQVKYNLFQEFEVGMFWNSEKRANIFRINFSC